MVKSYTYDAYGNTQSTGGFVNSFAYTGAVIDIETGLYYMNARYYDPATGRFISEDTYRGDGEAFWHLYAYCDGDPVNNTDPTGHIQIESGSESATFVLKQKVGLVMVYFKIYLDFYENNSYRYDRIKKVYIYVNVIQKSFIRVKNVRVAYGCFGGYEDPNGTHGMFNHKYIEKANSYSFNSFCKGTYYTRYKHFMCTGQSAGWTAASFSLEYSSRFGGPWKTYAKSLSRGSGTAWKPF